MKDFNELMSEDQPIFEAELTKGFTEEEIKEAEVMYTAILEQLNSGEIDEGLLGSIIGGAAGLIAGPALGKAICNALGITQGILYDVLTSRLVTTAIGAAIGKRV